ncbi:hypothetical protein NDU88_007578 [Pleurodeles waltl]|uniref:Uncharacterized protein n=1 Tax=Pleurodeles waltl TaxID=8319 RepID=A0AAV7QQ97_PLEWA|nr:hypothetical protein NDU88_007578 [Pleurodeles waltl]
MSSGREPIGLDFRVTVGRNRPFTPSPHRRTRRRGKNAAKTVREKAAATAREKTAASEREKVVKDPRTAEDRKAGEASVAVFAVESGEDTGTPAALQDSVEDQEAVHQNPGHTLGRAWLQQVCGVGLTKIKRKEGGKREGE